MNRSFVLASLIGLFMSFVAYPLEASQTRVDSTGGLDMVLTDETTDINPYNLDNPAGLSLLPAGSRIEIGVPYYSVTNKSGSYNDTTYGLSAGSTLGFSSVANGEKYQGFLDVPNNGLAFQVFGSLVDDNSQGSVSIPTQTGDELINVSKQFGRFSIGTELEFIEWTSTYPADYPGTGPNTSSWSAKTGFLYNIPLDEGGTGKFLRLGGSFLFNVLPLAQSHDLTLSPAASIKETEKIYNDDFEPCFYLDIPGSFQGGLLVKMLHYSETDEITSTNVSYAPDLTPSVIETDDSEQLVAIYKWKIPLSDSGDPHPFTFNQGGSLSTGISTYNDYYSTGNNYANYQINNTQYKFGIGLERDKNFTIGIQLDGITSGLNVISSTYLGYPQWNHSKTQLTLGGEKWLTQNLTLRIGFTYLDEKYPPINSIGLWISTDYFDIYAGEEISGICWSTGVGYEDKSLRLEGLMFLEQPQSTGGDSYNSYTGPDYAYTVFGGQLSVAWLFGQ